MTVEVIVSDGCDRMGDLRLRNRNPPCL